MKCSDQIVGGFNNFFDQINVTFLFSAYLCGVLRNGKLIIDSHHGKKSFTRKKNHLEPFMITVLLKLSNNLMFVIKNTSNDG